MKKTLFLSAMLATALCSSAFAVDYTATVTSENSPLNLDAYLDNTNTAIYLTMNNGTTVTNENNNSDFNKVQISQLTLSGTGSTGTINVAAGKHYGFVKSGFNEQTLTLNGGTLQKTGAGELIIINTKVADSDTGTLYIKEGSAKVYYQGSHGLVGRNLTLKVGNGATMTLEHYNEVNTLDIESGATVTVANGATLAMNTYSASEAKKVTLSGTNSKLQVKVADFANSENDFSELGSTGVLRVLGTASGNNAAADTINLAQTTSLSKVELSRIYGTLQAAGSAINTNFNLVTESGKAALDITSVAGSEYTFNGNFTGGSNFAVITGKTEPVTMNFNGDLSGWTTTGDAWSGLSIKGGSVIANIGGSVSNTTIANAFNLNLDGGQTGKLVLNINRDATLTNTVRVTEFSVGTGVHVSATHNTFSANSVTLNSDSELTLGTADNHDKNLTTSSLTVAGDSTLNANLVMSSGVMSFAHDAQLTMGCSVTIGDTVKVVLTDEDIATIQSGQTVDLILDAEQITLGSGVTELSNIYRQNSDGTLTKLSSDFKIVADSDNKKVYAMPEPATATLSLLALAALASRRKRH